MDTTTLLVVAGSGIAIGFIIGILIQTLRGDRQHLNSSQMDEILKDRQELARFLRGRPSGQLQAIVDNRLVATPADLNAEQRDRLESLVLELRTWLGFPPFPSQEPFSTAEITPVAHPAMAPAAVPAGTAAAPAAVANPPFKESKSIVGQIDDILQERLAASDLSGRNVRLVEKPNQGVVVMIGLDQFPGIDEVPDQDVRNIIRQAVAEWELRAR